MQGPRPWGESQRACALFWRYTVRFFATYTGKVSLPARALSVVIFTFLSVTTYSTWAPGSTMVFYISTQFFTLAPFFTFTPRNSTQFSTSPSMMQPSATTLFFTWLSMA